MAARTSLPGLSVAVSSAAASAFDVVRSGDNVWWAAFAGDGGDPDQIERADLDATRGPSSVLAAREAVLRSADRPSPRDLTLAKIELDACGAWCTVANASPNRPLLVRRAGWVDLRGHPSHALGGAVEYHAADDRIGLGPGDALVLAGGPLAPGGWDAVGEPDASSEQLLDALLEVCGRPAPDLVDAALGLFPRGDREQCPVTAITVPDDLGADPVERVVRATGIPRGDLQLPGYPLGDLQPELWREPPRPPRVARLRLSADTSNLRTVRELLDRLLASWRLDGRVDDEGLALAASELAANAIVHTDKPETVTVRFLGDVVRVEIDDGSDALPEPKNPEPGDLSGRGLYLVDALTSSWGVEPQHAGKRVWCEVDVARAAG